MTIYAKQTNANLKNIPQTMPLPGQNMVQNNAGGFGYEISPQEKLERFLLIGSEGGTYYVSEQKLTEQNSKAIIAYIKADGASVLRTVTDYAVERRAPKMDALLYVLALLTTHASAEVKKDTYSKIPLICNTATHLFTFLENALAMRGWSRGLRNAIAKWYTVKSDDKLAYQMVKYRQRNGWTHRDAIRLAHPTPLTETQGRLFKYAVGKFDFSVEALEKGEHLPILVEAFEMAQKTTTVKTLAKIIAENGLTWEMIPTQFLNDETVLKALLPSMPLHALIRNLGRYSKAGLTAGNSDTTKAIVDKLNAEAVKAAKLHPIVLVNAMRVYAQGRGDKGSSIWTVNQNIVDALNEAYYYALDAIVPTNKDILVALDTSGSMQSPVANMGMPASQIGAVLALTVLRSEPGAEVIGFTETIQANLGLGRRTSLDDAMKMQFKTGGTNCALAFKHALNTGTRYDAIIILTDNETWAGPSHGKVLLDEYRKKYNRNVKVIEVAMVANPYSTMPENDKNLLRIVGFDAAAVTVINKFLES